MSYTIEIGNKIALAILQCYVQCLYTRGPIALTTPEMPECCAKWIAAATSTATFTRRNFGNFNMQSYQNCS